MFRFGATSEMQLVTCDPRLQKVLRRALAYGVMDFRVLKGHRGQVEQDLAFAQGNSKLRWPHGNHNANPSRAADLLPVIPGVPAKVVWTRQPYWYMLAGIVLSAGAELMIPIRFGGDWNLNTSFEDQTFNDLGHFELALN